MNTESARETFYRELIQNTNLPTNHNFTSIITEINKEIEHHTQQRYPITYASKGKRKLQTPAKKNRVESPSNPSYHYIPGSAINISSTDAFSSTTTSVFGQFSFQSRQKKTELLEPYEFTYQHLITENLEVETPNIQTQQQLENPKIKTPNIRMSPNQRNQNPELINQQNLPPVIVIDQLPINPVAKPIQQPLQLPPNTQYNNNCFNNPMTYAPIAKLDNFTGKEDDTQVWLNNIEKAIAANGWNDAQAMQAIPYFLKDTANS
ncbi:hypothetical protein G9A89_007540 [Geosiphon pyriformis]|nr:hypothetical protein G9A89_007540 [Geosiphon pyriformis]